MKPTYEFGGKVAAVVLADITEDAVLAASDDLTVAGHQALGVTCDVSDEAQVAAVVERAVDTFGRLDMAFNKRRHGTVTVDKAAGTFAVSVTSSVVRNMIGQRLTRASECLRIGWCSRRQIRRKASASPMSERSDALLIGSPLTRLRADRSATLETPLTATGPRVPILGHATQRNPREVEVLAVRHGESRDASRPAKENERPAWPNDDCIRE